MSIGTVTGTRVVSDDDDVLDFFQGDGVVSVGLIWSRFWKNSGMTLTRFRFFIVCNPKIRSTSESSAIRTGRLKV